MWSILPTTEEGSELKFFPSSCELLITPCWNFVQPLQTYSVCVISFMNMLQRLTFLLLSYMWFLSCIIHVLSFLYHNFLSFLYHACGFFLASYMWFFSCIIIFFLSGLIHILSFLYHSCASFFLLYIFVLYHIIGRNCYKFLYCIIFVSYHIIGRNCYKFLYLLYHCIVSFLYCII